MRSLTVISGVPVDDVTLPEAVDRIDEMVGRGRELGRTHQVTTVNVDFIINSMHDPGLREVLQGADLSIPDGMPVVWGSRLLGSPLRERVAGADLVPALIERAQCKGYRVLLFGSAPGVAESAAEMLRNRWPGADVLGYGGPLFDDVEDMDPQALEAIRSARADIICVALGHPKQERWIQYYGPKLDVPVMVGVGGTLDFIAGRKARAPMWMQRNGLEWLHRLISEPRRLGRRYARDLRHFAPVLLSEAWRMRKAKRAGDMFAEIESRGGESYIRLHGAVDMHAHPMAGEAASALASGRNVTIDISDLDRLDQPTVAALFALAHGLRLQGAELHLVTARHHRSGTLRRLRLDHFFNTAPAIDDDLAFGGSDSGAFDLRQIA